jgi:hypothetical protein
VLKKGLEILNCNLLSITLTDNSTFTADLKKEFSELFCYPKDLIEWKQANINEGAFAIDWKSGFDIHFDQIIVIALKQKLIH